MRLAKERIICNHNLITNKFPRLASLSKLDTVYGSGKLDIGKFGLFEVSSPNFNTYFPDVSQEDLSPKDEDFVYPIYRALSSTLINKYGPIDFGADKTLLQRTMGKLIGQSLYTNHEAVVGNELGVVLDVDWQESRKNNGINIPAGINARLKVDGKSNPKMARGMMMDPPSVHSTSVTVEFAWEPSHKNMEKDEFFEKLGSFDDDGKMIKRNVSDIRAYHELSFVAHGADPYAQKIDQAGNINNPNYASTSAGFSAEDYQSLGHYIDFKDVTYYQIEGFNKSTNINNKPKSRKMDETLMKFLREQLELSADATEEQITQELQAKLPEFKTTGSSVTQLEDELTELKEKYPEGTVILSSEDEAKLAKFDEVNTIAETALTSTRNECEKLYKLSVDNKVDDGILKLIKEANFDTIAILSKQYKQTVEAKFQATCEKCGSTEITRASSQTADGIATPTGGSTTGGEDTHTEKSNAELSDNFLRERRKQSVTSIHGAEAEEDK